MREERLEVMRLVDLNPAWIMRDNVRIGFTFESPVQHKIGHTKWRLSCFTVPMTSDQQFEIFDDEPVCHCKPGVSWTVWGGIQNADFRNMTVHPSIDASPGGLWHGFIRAGEIV